MSRKLFLPLAVLAFLSSAVALYSLSDTTPTNCYPPLSLVTTSVPSGTAGSAYSVQLVASGGQPAYSWSFGQSSLPSGFSISSSSGEVTGTPPTAGTYKFNVVVSDSLKSSVTGELTLTVAAAPTGTGTTGTGTTGTGTTGTGTTGTGTTGTGTTGTGTTGTGTTGTGTTGTGTTGTGTTGTGTTGTGTTGTGTTGTGTTGTGTTGTGTTGTGTTGTGTTGTGTTGTGTTGTGTTGTGTTGTGTTGTGTTGTGTTGTGTTGTGTTPPTGTALTACKDLTASGSYYLANDVSSAGTCFGIDANNITLNLNGHTITYGTGGGSTPTPAIEGHDSWWTGTPNYTGTSYASSSQHSGLEVYGGSIVQSPNSATFSDVFAFGQGTFSSAPYIHDITATFQNTGAQFYNSAYLPTGAKIENNTIYDNVTNIQQPGQGYLSARAAFQGEAIYVSGQENNPVTSGDLISGNKIVGGPQGGILTLNQYSTISNNDIAQNATYSNDWCVEIDSDHTTATGNNCHPTSGRGINIDANYVTVENNTLNTTELPQNMEYGTNGQPGCELGGAYGVRIETMPLGPSQPGATTNDTVSGNTINVTANACNAMGVDLIYIPATATGLNVTGNIITTTNAGKSGVQDAGLQFDDAFGNGISITGNTVTSTDEWMYGWWDGYSGITVGHNTWNGTPSLTFLAQDGGCDPTQTDSGASCPVSINITDSLPNKVSCGAESTAKITVNGQVTQCKPTE
ncbi:MAG: right-handed parallel beta-helix repeat-containing protein [Acidobacteriaceae bacterium]